MYHPLNNMALVYHGETDAGVVVIVGHGHIKLADWASVIAAQIEDGRWHLPTLIDISDPIASVSLAETGAAIIRATRELVDEHGERGPIALVVGNAELHAEAHRYLDTFRRVLPHRIEVFAERADAITWVTSLADARHDARTIPT